MSPWLAWHYLCRQDWQRAHRAFSASAYCVLIWKACATMPSPCQASQLCVIDPNANSHACRASPLPWLAISPACLNSHGGHAGNTPDNPSQEWTGPCLWPRDQTQKVRTNWQPSRTMSWLNSWFQKSRCQGVSCKRDHWGKQLHLTVVFVYSLWLQTVRQAPVRWADVTVCLIGPTVKETLVSHVVHLPPNTPESTVIYVSPLTYYWYDGILISWKSWSSSLSYIVKM